MSYDPESRTHCAFVPGILLDADEVIYYVTAKGHSPGENSSLGIYRVPTEVMPELPEVDEEVYAFPEGFGVLSHDNSAYDWGLYDCAPVLRTMGFPAQKPVLCAGSARAFIDMVWNSLKRDRKPWFNFDTYLLMPEEVQAIVEALRL